MEKNKNSKPLSESKLKLLLSISQSIAVIKTRKELFDVIKDKVQPVFGFGKHTKVAVLNKEGQALSDFFAKTSVVVRQITNAARTLGGVPVSGIFKKIIESPEPVLLDESWAKAPKQNPIDKVDLKPPTDFSLKNSLSYRLETFEKVIGSFHVHFYKVKNFSKQEIQLFKSITNLIAIAVQNILANEEILEREKEKTILLSLSEHISGTRDRNELFNVIAEKIKDVFQYYSCFLYVKDESEGLVKLWFENGRRSSKLDPIIERQVKGQTLKGKVAKTVLVDSPPFVLPREIMINGGDDAGAEYIRATNIEECMVGPLKIGREIIGCINLTTLKKGHFTGNHLLLYKSVCEQVASAVANILANEEILAREKEKSQLLKISEAIASIQNYKELLGVIYEKIQPVFPFDNTGIFIADKNEVQVFEITDVEILKGKVSNKFTDAKLTGPFLLKDFKKGSWYHSGTPLITNLKNEIELISDPFCKEQFRLGIAAGLQEMICGPLITGGKKMGAIYLSSRRNGFYTEKNMVVFKSLIELIAIAVANIIANQEIAESEKEKTLLLEINEAITLIKDKVVLFKVMMQKLILFAAFDNAVLVMLSKDGRFCNGVIEAVDSGEDGYAKFDNIIPILTAIKNSPAEFLQQQPDLYIWDALEMEKQFPNHPYLRMMHNRNLRYGVYLKVNWDANQQVGFLNFHFGNREKIQTRYFNLFKSIATQLAISLANILANEEIMEREQEKSSLLSISTQIARVKNQEDLFGAIMDYIKPLIKFDEAAVIFVIDWDTNTYSFFFDKLYLASETKEMEKWKKQARPIVNDPVIQYLIHEKKVTLICLDDAVKKFGNYPVLESAMQSGIEEALHAPLLVQDKLVGFLSVNAKNKGTFKTASFNFYQSIADNIALAVSNILANHEIESKAREIENLNKQLQAQNNYLIEEVQEEYNFDEMIGQNKAFQSACQSIGLVAKTYSSVLILGETGTGKELVARAIHNHSTRKNKPLIKLNCAALPANLIESELFGHERGAFTGAIERRIGKFELANGSTLFLDEVGELPLELQAKLLRALQEKEIERLGSNKTMQIDVRIIAATNRDLVKEVKDGKFRQDLYYRLHIFPITLPPLRERKEDIPLLASHFIQKYSKKIGKNIQGLNHKAMQEMMGYGWPGNIRELEHVIERSIILSKTKLIQDLDLPLISKNRITASPNEFVIKPWEEQERDYILEVLKVTKGNMAGKGGAAELLQLPPTTLQSKMKKLGIKRKHFVEK